MSTAWFNHLSITLAISFALVVIARWLHPALFDVEVTYWLAGLTALVSITVVFLNKEKTSDT